MPRTAFPERIDLLGIIRMSRSLATLKLDPLCLRSPPRREPPEIGDS
jgi:hypothetical protein